MGPCQFSYGKHFKNANQILCLPGAAAGQAGGSRLSPSCCRRHLPTSLHKRWRKGKGPVHVRKDLSKNKGKKPLYFMPSWCPPRLADTRWRWGKDPTAVAWSRGGVVFLFFYFYFIFSGKCNVCAEGFIFFSPCPGAWCKPEKSISPFG